MGCHSGALGEVHSVWHRWSEEGAYGDEVDNEVYWEGSKLNCSFIDRGHSVNCDGGDDVIYINVMPCCGKWKSYWSNFWVNENLIGAIFECLLH